MANNWNFNNAAHAFTWQNLRAMFELPMNVSFPDAKDYQTRNLNTVSSASSDEMRKSRARSLASKLDRMYRLLQRATMESGKKSSEARKKMAEAIIASKGTVSKIGKIADDYYKFYNE